jgi:hypothetical protein
VLEKIGRRAALGAGTLAGEAALGVGSLGCSEDGAVEWIELRRRAAANESACGRGRGGLREAWADGAEGGCIVRVAEVHRAMMRAVATAAGRQVRVEGVEILAERERRRDDREAESCEQEQGEESPHVGRV